jgi:Na+-transporting methylmalonyl-CoA/oxaloacetate decarboxylase gamma subunit
MNELLSQALILTLVGMGMTFAAIGILVLGMYALTTFLADGGAEENQERSAAVEAPDDQAPLQVDVGRYHAAAAAAVAVALAQAADTYQAKRPGRAASGDAWTAHVRATQLARREYHNSRRAGR